MKFCFCHMTVCGWLPPCHEGAADCRPDRHLSSVSLCKSSLTHLHASSLLQPFSVSRSKVSRVKFISQVKIKSFKETVHGEELTVTWPETVERKLNTCETTKRVDGLGGATKPKASPARAKANKTKARAKTKERENNTARKGRKDFTKWRARRQTRNTEHKTGQENTEWVDTSWDHADNTGGRVAGAQICGMILHGSKLQDSCHRRCRPKHSPVQRMEEAYQC